MSRTGKTVMVIRLTEPLRGCTARRAAGVIPTKVISVSPPAPMATMKKLRTGTPAGTRPLALRG